MTLDKSVPYMDWDKYLKQDALISVSMAFKALVTGTATEEQQKLAMDFLIKIGCRTYDGDWFLDDRVSSFAAGRRFVGMQIVNMVNLKIGTLKEK